MIARILCRPFIGRADELAFLRTQRLGLNANRGGAVLISGEAGVGKSRVITEFCRTLGKSRTRVAIGQCSEFAQRPYAPILDMLERLQPNSVPAQAPASKSDFFDALVDRFASIAKRSALIAIVEDIHWADSATFEFLAYLASKLDSIRLLLIATYRPEELHARESESRTLAQIARTRRFASIELKPLDGPELRRFIDEALTGVELEAPLRRAVARMSEGNPFFTEELLKNAVELHELPVEPLGPRRLSTTVRATVLERLRPLSDRARTVLAQAAVIGRQFDIELLAAILPIGRDEILSTLQYARELQLVDEEPNGRFRFRHALTREAIYDQFLLAQVQPLHRTIARALAEFDDAGRSIASLAYHWWAAGDRENGIRYNALAGDAASAVFAYDGAIVAYNRALQLMPEPSLEQATLLAKIGRHRATLGAHRIAHQLLNDAADILSDCGDFDGEAAHRIAASQSAHFANVPDPCAPLEVALARLPADALRARTLLQLQLAWHEAGLRFRVDVASTYLAAIDVPTVMADADQARTYHSVGALIHCLTGNVAGLRAMSHAALAAGATLAQTDRTVWMEINTAMEFACLDLRAEARTHFSHARNLAVARKSRNLEAHIHAMSASMLFVDGDLAAVRSAVQAAADLRIDSAIIAGHCAAWGTLAGLALGDDALVETWFDERTVIDNRAEIEYFAAGYAEILSARGRYAVARAILHDALEGGDIRRGIVDTLIAVARYGDESDFGRARALLVAATDATVDVLEVPGLALFDAYVELRAGNVEAAAAHAREAARGFAAHDAPLFEASALEVAGEPAAALEIYNRLGAAGRAARVAAKRITPAQPRSSLPAGLPATISKREADVALLVTEGAANLQIAERLSISLKTVEKHMSAIYRKLGFSTRAQLAAWVLRSGADGAVRE